MLFKGLSIFGSGGQFVHWDRKIFSNFGRGSPKEHLSEIILKLVHWSRRRCCLRVFFFSIFSSGGQFCSAKRNDFKNCGRGSPKEHFYEIIFKSGEDVL